MIYIDKNIVDDGQCFLLTYIAGDVKISITILILFLVFSVSMSIYGDELNFDMEKDYVSRVHKKALILMNKINHNNDKSKDLILSVFLEVELDVLEDLVNSIITGREQSLIIQKEWLCSATDQFRIQDLLKQIEYTEKYISVQKNALQTIAHWKEQYCH